MLGSSSRLLAVLVFSTTPIGATADVTTPLYQTFPRYLESNVYTNDFKSPGYVPSEPTLVQFSDALSTSSSTFLSAIYSLKSFLEFERKLSSDPEVVEKLQYFCNFPVSDIFNDIKIILFFFTPKFNSGCTSDGYCNNIGEESELFIQSAFLNTMMKRLIVDKDTNLWTIMKKFFDLKQGLENFVKTNAVDESLMTDFEMFIQYTKLFLLDVFGIIRERIYDHQELLNNQIILSLYSGMNELTTTFLMEGSISEAAKHNFEGFRQYVKDNGVDTMEVFNEILDSYIKDIGKNMCPNFGQTHNFDFNRPDDTLETRS